MTNGVGVLGAVAPQVRPSYVSPVESTLRSSVYALEAGLRHIPIDVIAPPAPEPDGRRTADALTPAIGAAIMTALLAIALIGPSAF